MSKKEIAANIRKSPDDGCQRTSPTPKCVRHEGGKDGDMRNLRQ
jgi:hypothetical protein